MNKPERRPKKDRYKNVGRKKLPPEVRKERKRLRDQAYFKKYYEKNREKILEKNRKRSRENKEKVKSYRLRKKAS